MEKNPVINLFNRKTSLNFYGNPEYLSTSVLKPDYAYKFAPEWFKKISPEMNQTFKSKLTVNRSTIKACPGIKNIYRSGIIIPMWTDISIICHPDGNMHCEPADGYTPITSHPREMYRGFYENHNHIKIVSPWHIDCNKNTKFLYTSPLNHESLDENFKILSGVVDYRYQHTTSLNVFIPIKKQSYQINIAAGTPVVQLINLSDEIPIIKFKNLTIEEYKSKFNKVIGIKWNNNYNFIHKSTIKNESQTC